MSALEREGCPVANVVVSSEARDLSRGRFTFERYDEE